MDILQISLWMWLFNFSLLFMFSPSTWATFPFKTQRSRARTSGPLVVCFGLSSVSRGSSPRRQAEETLCTPCSLRPQPSSLFACDPHCTSVGLCTDLLLLCFLRLPGWMALFCGAIWKGDLYEALNIHEFLSALLDSCMVSLWGKG